MISVVNLDMARKKASKPYGLQKEESTEHLSILNEPGLAFGYPGITASGPFPFDAFDHIAATRKGISKNKLFDVAAMYGVTLDELSAWLHSSYRNLQRKADNDLLDSSKSERLLELVHLANRGVEVLGSLEKFRLWIQSPILALGNQKPASFLDTSFGIQHLEHLLGRLETGVFS